MLEKQRHAIDRQIETILVSGLEPAAFLLRVVVASSLQAQQTLK